ncbi:FKBP-type peptidyl-prolyl cis-trans isomerase [Streptomyces triticisoli]|uniref:FKBP-type peptidyl-prolyl cis-trans isomerase n=1 Tax=Streptomyces triticisoli TaxID=2182797 RepID=UPI0018E58F35|nr:FKBP-type peptidyl-prolyl cis-trans isomerase [Streptomyces triticisoli]
MHTDDALPTVSGRTGERAAISVPRTRPSGEFVITERAAGHGATARKGDIAVVAYTAAIWRSGKALPCPYDEGTGPQLIPVGRGATLPALDLAVQGRRAGSRMLVVAPPAAAYGVSGNPRLGVTGDDTLVFVVDLLQIIPAHATVDGDQTPIPASLPQARVDRRSAIGTISVPDRDAPAKLLQRILVEGRGRVVRSGQQVVLQQSTAVWQSARGKHEADLVMSSQADGGPAPVVIGRGNVIQGWDEAVVGQRVGTRLLLVIPADKAFGARGPKGIPDGATLVSVIDVLAAV